MKKIARSQAHVLVITDKSIKLYNKARLLLITEIPMGDINEYFLHDSFLFVARRSGRVEALLLSSLNLNSNSTNPLLIADLPKNPVRALYARENLLCVGTENGTVRKYLFNDVTFKMQNEYKHNGPINSIATDGITILVTDHLQRITEYPSIRSYDFKNPRIYSGRYLMCTEGGRIYLRTNEAFGQFYQAEQQIEDLFLSEKGGFIFIRNSSQIICIDSENGEIKGEYAAGECVVANDALLSYVDGRFEIIDLFFEDKEMGDVKFRSINIVERKIDGEESNRKHLYVQDGGGRAAWRMKGDTEDIQKISARNNDVNPGITKQNDKKYKANGDEYKKRQPIVDGKYMGASSFRMEEHFNNNIENSNNVSISFCGNTATSSFVENNSSLSSNHSSIKQIKQNDATLLYFSSEGYMLTVETPISNHVSIKYHDNSLEPLEFKDSEKSMLGCFYGRKFVISNGVIVNYNDEWTKKIKCRMVGLNEHGVFVFGELLTVFSFTGDIIEEILLSDYYTFCIETNKIAIFSQSHLTIIKYNDASQRSSAVFPVSKVSFCSFYGSDLYVESHGMIFKHEGCLFVKQCEVKGYPLAIYNEFVLALTEPPVLLPRPVISYIELNPNRKVQEKITVESAREKSTKFNILDQ